MIFGELPGGEDNPVYRQLQIENLDRQYDFLKSIVQASLDAQRTYLSQTVIKALNHHAITCLHATAGEYRTFGVGVGSYEPPHFVSVQPLMDDFVNEVNRGWSEVDPVVLATFVLWRLNHIHPFINGNGRTARAACYFVLCVTAGGWLPGETILPELIKRDRNDYVDALKKADQSFEKGKLELAALHELLQRLLEEQLADFDTKPEPASAE